MKKIIVLLLVAASAAISTFSTSAADSPAEKKDAPARATPLRGKLDAVDKQAKTFKINERTFHISSDTKIAKDGKPATFDDAAVGQDVTGSYREGADKKLNVVLLRIGKPATAPAAK